MYEMSVCVALRAYLIRSQGLIKSFFLCFSFVFGPFMNQIAGWKSWQHSPEIPSSNSKSCSDECCFPLQHRWPIFHPELQPWLFSVFLLLISSRSLHKVTFLYIILLISFVVLVQVAVRNSNKTSISSLGRNLSYTIIYQSMLYIVTKIII